MDDVVNGIAKELSDAIAAAVAEHPQVEAVRQKARAAGFELRVSLEAVIGFVNRPMPRTQPSTALALSPRPVNPDKPADFSQNDKRFLRQLRIGAGPEKGEETE